MREDQISLILSLWWEPKGCEPRIRFLCVLSAAHSNWVTLWLCFLINSMLWGYRSDSHAWKGDSTKNQAISLKALFYIKTRFLQANNNKKEQTRTKGNPPTVYNCDQPDSFESLGRTPNALQANSVGLHLPLCRRHLCTFLLLKKNFG